MNTKINLHRYGAQIAELERGLIKNPPAAGGVLFYGSSTMANWREGGLCYRQMQPLPITNTGFGGSTAEEALYHYHKLVFPVKPAVMAYYEGANDLAAGYTPAEILDNTHHLFEWCRQDFPSIKFIIIPIKLSPGLNAPADKVVRCNELFTEYTQAHADASIIDVAPLLYDKNGKHRDDIYVEDKLHHNAAGYEILASILKPEIERVFKQE